MFIESQQESARPISKVAQETLDLMGLASKELPLARQRAKTLHSYDLDVEKVLIFLGNPNSNLSGFATELMMKHFPDRLRFSALRWLLSSTVLETRERAKELLIANHPGKLDDILLRAFADSADMRVSAMANELINNRAEFNLAFMR